MVMLVAGCGDNLVLDDTEEGRPVEDEPSFEEPASRLAPDVCAVRSWPSVAFDGRDVDLAVAPTATGAAIFTTARSGGPLRGFTIDGSGQLTGKETGTIVRDDQAFTAVSAGAVDGRLVTAAVGEQGAAIDLVREDLGAFQNLTTSPGTVVGDLPIATSRLGRVATIGDEAGLTAISFDDSWTTSGTRLLSKAQPLSMTATRYLTDTMASWSTDTTCHLQRMAAGVTSQRNFACIGARIAASGPDREGYLVYEDGDRVMISQLRVGGESEIANQRELVPNARSPRIVYDGARYWVSYIDVHDDVIVGYLEADGSLASMALNGTQPQSEAYELAIVNNGLWVFAVDGGGVGAQRICLRAVR